MKNRLAALYLAMIMLFELIGNTSAQTGVDKEKAATPEGPVLIAPYDKKMMRLAEVLGSIHFLRELCQANEEQLWRNKMAMLIEAEKPRPARKTRLISRFNRGFGSYRHAYRNCTPAALLAVDRLMKEGVRLTSQITSRYGR